MPVILTIAYQCEYLTMQQWNEGLEPAFPEQSIPLGSKVQYMAHLPGGMLKVKLDNDTDVVINPLATDIDK